MKSASRRTFCDSGRANSRHCAPLKRGGSRRYYRPRDIELLHQIKHLLHDQGYTIKGALKALRQGDIQAPAPDEAAPDVADDPDCDAPGSDTRAQMRQALQALAAECASVAAGNSPPLRQD